MKTPNPYIPYKTADTPKLYLVHPLTFIVNHRYTVNLVDNPIQ